MYSDNEDYLIEILQNAELVTASQVGEAREKKNDRENLVESLIRLGYVSEEDATRTFSVEASIQFVDLSNFTPPEEIIALVPPDVAGKYHIVPVGFDDNRLQVALTDPFDYDLLDTLNHVLEYDVDPVCATPTQVHEALNRYYGGSAGGDDEIRLVGETLDTSVGVLGGEDAPIIKMVSQLFSEAFKNGASDIHIEPLEKEVRIRYRIDGVLHQVNTHPRKLLAPIVARIKIMTGSMSIAEKRIPQDGRIQLLMGKKGMDLRVSTIPTSHGESIVMRVLDKSSLTLGLPQLGFLSDDQATFEKLITLPDGILLVTGPTGSGKTTTLYACLNYINRPDRKIITVEDPVEYQMSGINQVMVKEAVGMTFAAALRSILRQAPNIIMIGEIRDLETATIAINASLTGHLVFSTLHTNDAPSAVARMADIGVKNFLIASAVRAIMAQRLVRKLCDSCKQPAPLSEAQMKRLGIDPKRTSDATIMGPNGCQTCRGTGHKGRMGIFEVFVIDDEVRGLINQNLSTPRLRERARELGMRTLREDGIRKVLAGTTSAEEIIRVTMSDSD